jgi:hypothetical protein
MGRKPKVKIRFDENIDLNDPLIDESVDSSIDLNLDDLDNLEIPEDIEDGDISDDIIVLSNHSSEGKHSLKYDSIFKGKKDEELDDFQDTSSHYYNESYEVDKSTIFHDESQDNENYVKQKRVKQRVYEVLVNKTELNFMAKRRVPSKRDFNNYFLLLKIELKEENFTNVEIFNELSYYFSDNLFNMFKLLDNKFRLSIISELNVHVGKTVNSKEITNRNIYEGTEIEFYYRDIFDNEKLFTGVVIKTDYEESIFRVDSYENIYDVHISNISRILNNTKFKTNLSKLNNIDFL